MGLQQLPGVHPEGRVLAVGEHAGRCQGGGEDVESEGEGADVLRLGFLNFDILFYMIFKTRHQQVILRPYS